MTTRSEEVSALLSSVTIKLVDFLARADAEFDVHKENVLDKVAATALVSRESLEPVELQDRIATTLHLPQEGCKENGLLDTVDTILKYSVNTSCPGFMDKLYSSPLPPGIAAELILSVLNTNVHVYQVSPILTLIEKCVTKALAKMFGFSGPRAGGISVQGGSASNMTSIVVARNSLFPQTKLYGNSAQNSGKLTLFTSAHSHYSIEKAALALGFGSQNVISVPVDKTGRMNPNELDKLIHESKKAGSTPFYINATAGTTVLGSFDPFEEIAIIANKYRCWLHIDGAWGGGFVFANRSEMANRLRGIEKADSIAFNPHKMLGVPLTCSFLLAKDLKLFQTALTLKAGYLFHDIEDDMVDERNGTHDQVEASQGLHQPKNNGTTESDVPFDSRDDDVSWEEPYDLADLTLQCGRRGDSLKLFMSWQYYGTNGYREKIENAYDVAVELSQLIDSEPDLTLVLGKGIRPDCFQVCFYYTPEGHFVFGSADGPGQLQLTGMENDKDPEAKRSTRKRIGKHNTVVTSRISKALIGRGFLIDFAPALEDQEEKGSFFRVVVNISTIRETTVRLVNELLNVGSQVVDELRSRHSD